MGRILLALVSTLFLVVQVMAGTWTSNNFLYKPDIGSRGADEKARFDSGLNRVDSRLANEKWLNDSLYDGDLGTAITAIGSTKTVLSLPAGNWPIASNLTVPANLTLKLAHGAVLAIATDKTLTINGPLEAGLYQIFSCAGTGKVTFGKGAVKETYAEWWGAIGDNVTDNYAPMQQAITMTANSQCPFLKLLGATYYCSDALEIPTSGINHHGKFTLRGTRSTTIDKTNAPEGTVIRVPAGKDALRTPIVVYTGTLPEVMARYAKHIEISDIYVQGPMVLGDAFNDTKGFRLGGVQFLRTNNLHAQGFGYGLYLENGSELLFNGTTMMQNNYYGCYIKRDIGYTDMQAWFDNLITVHNYINVWMINPRSVWVKSGENITYGTLAPLTPRPVQPRIKITGCTSESQIHFTNYTMENDEDTACAQVDSSGIGILTFNQCNFASTLNRIVSCDGFFNQITITNSVMDRTYLSVTPRPVVELTNALTIDPNGWCYANQVTLEGNSPPWADMAVKDSSAAKNPYRDYVPKGFQQVNQRRECDDAAFPGPIPVAGGGPLFTTANKLCGKARLYFTSATNNNLICYFPRPIIGAEIIYITMILDDNSGANLAGIILNGVGPGGANYSYPYKVALETYTVGTRTFTKWLYCFVVMNKALSVSPGIDWIAITGIWYNSGTPAASGIEMLSIYVDTRQVGSIAPGRRNRPSSPASPADGYWTVGEMLYNTTPASGQPPSWYCTVAGNPGTWLATANLP